MESTAKKEKEGDAFLSRVKHPGNHQHNSLPLSPLCSPPSSIRRITKTHHLSLFSVHIHNKHPSNHVFPPLSLPLSIRRIVFCREKRGEKEEKRERCLRCKHPAIHLFPRAEHPANRERGTASLSSWTGVVEQTNPWLVVISWDRHDPPRGLDKRGHQGLNGGLCVAMGALGETDASAVDRRGIGQPEGQPVQRKSSPRIPR